MSVQSFKALASTAALAVALSLGAGSLMPIPAHAQASEAKMEKAKKPKKAKKEKPTTATFYDGTKETVTQRERRLKRECKGKPNAGACEGYAR